MFSAVIGADMAFSGGGGGSVSSASKLFAWDRERDSHRALVFLSTEVGGLSAGCLPTGESFSWGGGRTLGVTDRQGCP
jgi:hypothetical protein